MLVTLQGLGAGVGRGEDGVGTGVMLGAGVGRGDAVGRGDGGGGTGVRWGGEVGRGVGVGRDLGVGLTLGLGVGEAPGMFAHCENSEVSSSVVSLHLPALPALTIDWISACERARLNTSTSSMSPLNGWGPLPEPAAMVKPSELRIEFVPRLSDLVNIVSSAPST
jgi:hypothetical protein